MLGWLVSVKSGRRVSNPRPRAWEARALPTELRPRSGLEPYPAPKARGGRALRFSIIDLYVNWRTSIVVFGVVALLGFLVWGLVKKGESSLAVGEPVPVAKGSHVYLVDGSGYIFRAFHALPPLTRPSDGLPVGAVHGFCAMLWKLMQDAKAGRGPTHIAVIFDATRDNYRNEIYPNYKANRPPAPEVFVPALAAWPAAPAGSASPATLPLAPRPALN